MRFTTYTRYRGRPADTLNLKALLESGPLTPEMLRELRGEGEDDEEAERRLAALLDDIIRRMVAVSYTHLRAHET